MIIIIMMMTMTTTTTMMMINNIGGGQQQHNNNNNHNSDKKGKTNINKNKWKINRKKYWCNLIMALVYLQFIFVYNEAIQKKVAVYLDYLMIRDIELMNSISLHQSFINYIPRTIFLFGILQYYLNKQKFIT